ncbi:hypothetical protein Sjap_016177 [Stephania japonica]|uniref:G-patch domain-containing protein n=1 Tax=Stephania japonica TaxID=461633 RepID=A0AAP0IL32_9MAGN
MAGTEDARSIEEGCGGFEWDDESHLYYHASSGFYHDPNAGWYYSSRDGLYYLFENGNYVLLESDKGEERETGNQDTWFPIKSVKMNHIIDDKPLLNDEISQRNSNCPVECANDDGLENLPPPPSEWLEETLIDLYLSGYSDARNADELKVTSERDERCEKDEDSEIEEGEWIPEDPNYAAELLERDSNEGASQDEENWLAQYGQVIQAKEPDPPFPVMDLWDWAMVWETTEKKKLGKKKKYKLARLVGKLVKPSAKLHPSVPSGARVLKTAAICEVHVSLVRVSSGQVYRLRSPSLKYLSSLPTYDSSNPTKDWGFPDLHVNNKQDINLPNIGGKHNQETQDEAPACQDSPALSGQPTSSNKDKSCIYRDRAAERRALHGGYGTGPGQKTSGAMEASSPVSNSTEEAAAEALDMSFGAESYARRMMENMGWKEGEALGSTMKGLKEPLVAVGNKGYAGLGWVQRRPGAN